MRIILTNRSLAATPAAGPGSRRMTSALALGLSAGLTLTGCTLTDPDSPDSTSQATSADASQSVVLLDNNPLGTYNPVNNHGRNGESRIYEGLFRVEPGEPNTQPEIVPLLAAGEATPSDANRTWTVPVRADVKFSDNSTFGPEDVVATYTALINPAVASTELVRWQYLASVEIGPNDTVVFHLKASFPEFDRLLFTGIATSERLDEEKAGTADAVPAAESSLNTDPVGTGPYILSDLRADQAIFTAREDYWGDKPAVKEFVVRHVEDENARAATPKRRGRWNCPRRTTRSSI